MAIVNDAIKDMEKDKFIESPTRSGKPAIETVVSGVEIDVTPVPINSILYGVISVTNTAVALKIGASNMTDRRTITIQPKGGAIFIGYDNTVTAGNSGTGEKITNGEIVELDLDAAITIYAIKNGSGSVNVHVAEKASV